MEVDKELKEQFDTLPEINVYFLIKEIGTYMSGITDAYKKGVISEEKFNKLREGFPRLQNALEYGTRTLTRFGVEPTHDVGGLASAQYWAWYQWWDEYIGTLSDKSWENLKKAIEDKTSVERFAPMGTWKSRVPDIQKAQLQSLERLKLAGLA